MCDKNSQDLLAKNLEDRIKVQRNPILPFSPQDRKDIEQIHTIIRAERNGSDLYCGQDPRNYF